MLQARVSVPELRCEGCARIIGDALDGAPGVRRVEVDLPARRVIVEYDRADTTTDRIEDHIREAGFDCSCDEEDRGSAPRPARTARPPQRSTAVEGPLRGIWYALLTLGVVILAVAGYVGYELYPRFDLPAAQGVGLLLLAAGAGVASFFSPCAFPLLVSLLARETGTPAGAEGGALGKALRFATALSLGAAAFLLIAGVAIALGGGALFAGVTFTSGAGMTIRSVVGALLIGLGLVQFGVLPNPLHAVEAVSRPLMRRQAEMRRKNPTTGFALFGFGYLLAGFG